MTDGEIAERWHKAKQVWLQTGNKRWPDGLKELYGSSVPSPADWHACVPACQGKLGWMQHPLAPSKELLVRTHCPEYPETQDEIREYAPPFSLREHACNLLRNSLNQPTADFREGQWDVIEALVNKARLLVVQRTGWGKSILYFLTTRLLRERGAGPTLLISPLLSLMRNQIQAAKQIGVEAATINSDNKDEWDEIKRRLLGNEISVLLISPERLSNAEFRRDFLSPIAGQIGLLAVDEAHCISDWGHDFRPDYQRIPQILPELSADVPILCTTATANQRVTDDVLMHFGNGLRIYRGTLSRDSLCLQNIEMPDPETKMAWLAKYLPTLPGSGIVYVLTRRTADRVAAWLQKCGIEASAYYSGEEGMEPEERERLENCLLGNKVKALVATSALERSEKIRFMELGTLNI